MAEDGIDGLDRSILTILEHDGRASFREIARKAGASEATIRARYRRLTKSGLLRIVAFSDPTSLNGSQLALVYLRVNPDHHDNVTRTLASYSEVSYVSSTLGRFDVFAQFLVRDTEELWETLQRKVRPLEGVLEVSCDLEVRVHKLWFENTTAVVETLSKNS